MIPAVVVELSPADASSRYASALLETCDIGMHAGGRCVLGEDASPSEEGGAVAIVTWDRTASKARIDLGLRVRGRSRWQVRQLSFADADPEMERWRTVGFAIAIFVGESIAQEETRTTDSADAATTTGATTTDTADTRTGMGARTTDSAAAGADATQATIGSHREDEQASPPRFMVDARFVIAGGARGFPPAEGGEVRFSEALGDGRWLVGGALQATVQGVEPDGISLLIPSVAAGAGLELLPPSSALQFALRVEAVLRVVLASGTDPTTGAGDSGGTFVPALAQCLDGSWMWSHGLGVVAGVEISEALRDTEIRAHGRAVALIPGLDYAVRAGFRLALY